MGCNCGKKAANFKKAIGNLMTSTTTTSATTQRKLTRAERILARNELFKARAMARAARIAARNAKNQTI